MDSPGAGDKHDHASHADFAVWPRAAAIALAVAVAALVALAPFHAVNGVDNRTYFEMVGGVLRNGLPVTDNTWVGVIREAAPSFNVPKDGRLWGVYPPLHAYLAAPFLKLGGLRGIYVLNYLLFGALALAVYRAARRADCDGRSATLAAAMVLVATPTFAASFQTVAIPLALTLMSGALIAALRSLSGSAQACIAAGLLAGLATAAHLIMAGIGIALLLALGVASREPLDWSATARRAVRRYVLAFGAFLVPLVPLALLNGSRFGTHNPLSYGPCVWEMCTFVLGGNTLAAGGLVAFAAPVAGFCVAVLGGAIALRHRRGALAALALASVLIVVAVPLLRSAVYAMGRTLVGYFVHVVDAPPLAQPADGFAWLRSGRLVKGLFQCSPCFAAALAVRPRRTGPDAPAFLLVACALAHVAELALLGRYQGAVALGWPYLFSRYVIYGVPFLAILAARATRFVVPTRRQLIVVLACAALASLGYSKIFHDEELWTRVLLTVPPLAVACALVAALLLRRRANDPWLAAIWSAALAASVSMTLGIDNYRAARDASHFDMRLDRFAAVTPQRFAFVGWAPEADPILALRAVRDVHYIDLIEAKNWDNFRRIMDKWTDDGRPIFGAFPMNGKFSWPYADWDVPAQLVDPEQGFWRIGPPKRRAPP